MSSAMRWPRLYHRSCSEVSLAIAAQRSPPVMKRVEASVSGQLQCYSSPSTEGSITHPGCIGHLHSAPRPSPAPKPNNKPNTLA
jgi:hypothetical protein